MMELYVRNDSEFYTAEFEIPSSGNRVSLRPGTLTKLSVIESDVAFLKKNANKIGIVIASPIAQVEKKVYSKPTLTEVTPSKSASDNLNEVPKKKTSRKKVTL